MNKTIGIRVLFISMLVDGCGFCTDVYVIAKQERLVNISLLYVAQS
jgi:hypothetical protein